MTGATQSPPLARLLDETADALQAVRDGRSLTAVLAQMPGATRPAVQSLTFHALRWLGAATEARRRLAPKTPPPRVDALLVAALALLWPASTPPYADHVVVDQAVAAARRRTPAAAGFVNAVLRRFLRERDAVVDAVGGTVAGAWNHPDWWVRQLQIDWPDHWRSLLTEANRRPPMTLRVNVRRGSVDDYLRRLAAAGRDAAPLADADGWSPGAPPVVLAEPCAVHALPGFADGDVSVQDAAAQRAAPLLVSAAPLRRGARVLDACAAPGGKTAHLLEIADVDVVAVDADAARLSRVGETLSRLALAADTRVGDARRPADWWDGRPFDAILLDAPCTASGIVRRHPDVRWLRRPADIAALARVQAEMLDALWPLLAPGGHLLYATCSIFAAEGRDQIDAFLQRWPAGSATLLPSSPGHLLPSRDNADTDGGAAAPAHQDGFFYALLQKS